MNRVLLLAAVAALGFASGASAKSCKDAAGKFTKCPTAAAAPMAAPATETAPATGGMMSSAPATGGHPHCSKGKACGNSCIAKDKVCHKPG